MMVMNRNSDLSSHKRKRNIMKKKRSKNELDVDFIQSPPLTKEMEKLISENIKAYKEKKKKAHLKKAA